MGQSSCVEFAPWFGRIGRGKLLALGPSFIMHYGMNKTLLDRSPHPRSLLSPPLAPIIADHFESANNDRNDGILLTHGLSACCKGQW